jgi:hypothetical protein
MSFCNQSHRSAFAAFSAFSEDWSHAGEWEDHVPAKPSGQERLVLVALDDLSEVMGFPPRKLYAQDSIGELSCP